MSKLVVLVDRAPSLSPVYDRALRALRALQPLDEDPVQQLNSMQPFDPLLAPIMSHVPEPEWRTAEPEVLE